MLPSLHNYHIILSGEIEADENTESTSPSASKWCEKSTKCLIALFESHEEIYEDPTTKKKIFWDMIARGLKSQGHHISSSQAENKWRNLLTAHSAMMKNKQKTGQKRKTFRYFPEMEAFVKKRHDITPPYLDGSGMIPAGHNASEEADPQPGPSTSAVGNDNPDGKVQKKTYSAKDAIRKQTKKSTKRGEPEVLQFLREMEERKKAEREEQERRRDARTTERNNLLKDLINVLKN